MALAAAWRDSVQRPRVDAATLVHWDGLMSQWVQDSSMLLPVRKSGFRGSIALHQVIGRPLLCVDNAPANWAMSNALLGCCPNMEDVREALESGHFPVAMILSSEERKVAT